MPRTLLLADDSVTIRKVVELTFHDTDLRVVAVASGREALERLAECAPDIVLADVVMPGPTGYEICRAVKMSRRPVPVLLLAGSFEPFDAEQARSCGADGHVTKPFDSRSLVERVERLLESPVEVVVARPKVEPVVDPDVEAMLDDLASPPDDAATPAALRIDAPAVPAEPLEATGPPQAAPSGSPISSHDLDGIVRAVLERLSERVVREIAWDVVPDIAETVVRERLRELERDTD